jgi:hypothetical protein
MFDPVDESLDEIAIPVPTFAEFARVRAVAARRDDDLSATVSNRFDEFIRVVALVGNHGLRRVVRKQLFGADDVMFLAGAQTQLYRLALRIYRQVKFGAEAAARAAERFVTRPLFSGEPAAC